MPWLFRTESFRKSERTFLRIKQKAKNPIYPWIYPRWLVVRRAIKSLLLTIRSSTAFVLHGGMIDDIINRNSEPKFKKKYATKLA